MNSKELIEEIVEEINRTINPNVTIDDIEFDESRAWSLFIRGDKLNIPVRRFGAYRNYEGGGVRGPIYNNGREQDGTIKLGKMFEEALIQIENEINEDCKNLPEWEWNTGVLL